jgi:hypothetical protein
MLILNANITSKLLNSRAAMHMLSNSKEAGLPFMPNGTCPLLETVD